jgi:pyruvate dehydrogenase E2 component (dihydrolipoamide acetyltransferase)
MAEVFRLPDLGEGLVEVEIVRWQVPVGGEVEMDQPVVEVETGKAVVDVPSPYAGVVLHHGAAEGEMLEVGEVLVVVGQAGESWPDAPSGDGTPAGPVPIGADAAPIVGTLSEEAQELTPAAPAPRPGGRPQALPKVRKLARELGVDLSAVTGSGPAGRIVAADVTALADGAAGRGNDSSAGRSARSGTSGRSLSPVVRKLAEKHGVDLATVVGTGVGGRVTRDDVLGAARSHPDGAAQASSASPAVASGRRDGAGDGPASRREGDERRRLSPTRRVIAERMSRAWSEIPQVTAFDRADASRLLEVRAALRERHGQSMPVDALVVAAVVPVLQAFPEMNATLEGDELVLHGSQDVGIAVDTPDGLLVAVIRDAGSRRLLELAAEVRRLREGAQARTLDPADLSGQTFTVSNIGGVGGGHGTPIVPPGTTGILSVGRAADTPVVRDGRVEVAPTMPLSLSYDHRVIDGAVGRRFLGMLLENLAEPTLFLT